MPRLSPPPSERLASLHGRYPERVRFSQDTIRRGAIAMRTNWSNDAVQLFHIGLKAAFRHKSDIEELLRQFERPPSVAIAPTLPPKD